VISTEGRINYTNIDSKRLSDRIVHKMKFLCISNKFLQNQKNQGNLHWNVYHPL